jgi:hypothetical protein
VSSYYSNGSSREEQSVSRPGSVRRRVSDAQGTGLRSSIVSRSSAGSRTDSPGELARDESWNDDSFVSDYGVPISRHDDLEVDLEESDSDSILDLHTPLP